MNPIQEKIAWHRKKLSAILTQKEYHEKEIERLSNFLNGECDA